MKKFKDIVTLLEFEIGSGKMDYGQSSDSVNAEQKAGEYVARIIDLHDNMKMKGLHPTENMHFLVALRNYYMGKSHANDPMHKKHSHPENIKNYTSIIAREYPHLFPFIDSELK